MRSPVPAVPDNVNESSFDAQESKQLKMKQNRDKDATDKILPLTDISPRSFTIVQHETKVLGPMVLIISKMKILMKLIALTR